MVIVSLKIRHCLYYRNTLYFYLSGITRYIISHGRAYKKYWFYYSKSLKIREHRTFLFKFSLTFISTFLRPFYFGSFLLFAWLLVFYFVFVKTCKRINIKICNKLIFISFCRTFLCVLDKWARCLGLLWHGAPKLLFP